MKSLIFEIIKISFPDCNFLLKELRMKICEELGAIVNVICGLEKIHPKNQEKKNYIHSWRQVSIDKDHEKGEVAAPEVQSSPSILSKFIISNLIIIVLIIISFFSIFAKVSSTTEH